MRNRNGTFVTALLLEHRLLFLAPLVTIVGGTAAVEVSFPAEAPVGTIYTVSSTSQQDEQVTSLDEVIGLEPREGQIALTILEKFSRDNIDTSWLLNEAESDRQVSSSDQRIKGLRKEELGPKPSKSFKYLYEPVVGDVRLISSVKNLGTGYMKYLNFYNLYPTDLDRQQIMGIAFHPDDGSFIEDDRGQPLVHYRFTNVAPGTKYETWWRARIITWKIRYDIDPNDVGTLSDIPFDIAEEFLADDPIFQITHPTIISARNDALQGEDHPLQMAHNIFDWVQQHLDYNDAGGWDDAVTVIERGDGSCSEYAFAFISLCRSAGIPARWTGSIVRRGLADGPGPYRDDLHHRWAEVYIPRIGWIHCNVQGGTWASLSNNSVVTSQSSGPSNYLGLRYDSYRTWSFGSGSGTVDSERYGLWYSNLDSFFPMQAGSGLIWPHQGWIQIDWDILGDIESNNAELTMQLSRLGQVLWTAEHIDPYDKTINIPVANIAASGPHFALKLYHSNNQNLAGYLAPIEIRDDIDGDGMDDLWELSHWGNLDQTAQNDPDRDGASNICEYYGMTDPQTATLFASDFPPLGGEVGYGRIGYNEYGCGEKTGKIVVNGMAWDKSLGVHANSWIEYQVPQEADTFKAMYALEDHNAGKVVFQCYVNNSLVFTSPTVSKAYGQPSPPAMLQAPVSPGDRIKIVADSCFDKSNDHSCWLQPAFTRERIDGDINGDNKVDWIDLETFTSQWLATGCDGPTWCSGADVDHSGNLDFTDFAFLAEDWLENAGL